MKYVTSQKFSKLGNRYSKTFDVLFDKIPENIKKKLNSREIGELIDLLYDQKIYGETEMYYSLRGE